MHASCDILEVGPPEELRVSALYDGLRVWMHQKRDSGTKAMASNLGRGPSTSEDDKAAQRRANILVKSEDRMKRVLGLQAQADDTEETSTESSAETSTTTTEQPRAGATRRNRRLQSRSISITAPPSAVAVSATEGVAAAADIGRVEDPAPETAAGQGKDKESSVATMEEQAGEMKLRRRLQARTSMEGQVSNFQPSEDGRGHDHDVDDAKTAAAPLRSSASARGQRPGLITAFWTLDAAAKGALIRVLLIALTGTLTGVLLLLSNADDLRAPASKGSATTALQHGMRSKLLDYVEHALLHRDLETLQSSSTWRAWVWNRVFPERFESLPLPIVAVALHVVVVVLFSALSSRPRTARGESQRAEVAGLVTRHSAGTQHGQGDGEPDKPKSIVESVAANLGLGVVLSAFKRLQSVLLDVQIFLFFFITVVALGHLLAVLI